MWFLRSYPYNVLLLAICKSISHSLTSHVSLQPLFQYVTVSRPSIIPLLQAMPMIPSFMSTFQIMDLCWGFGTWNNTLHRWIHAIKAERKRRRRRNGLLLFPLLLLFALDFFRHAWERKFSGETMNEIHGQQENPTKLQIIPKVN